MQILHLPRLGVSTLCWFNRLHVRAGRLKVTGLKRVRIGNVRLGELPTGQWRYLRSDERF
jgi:hypothetical protein